MKLSISTFKILCHLWNYPEEVLEDREYLNKTLLALNSQDINFSKKEKETAIKEITKLLDVL